MSLPFDSVIRAITDDGAFRVIAAVTTAMVQGATRAQVTRAADITHFGDLLTGAVLVRETMAPDLRVQGILKGSAETGSLVADSHPDGTTRGLVQVRRGKAKVEVAEGSILQMMRTMPNGALQQGVVEVPVRGGISSALMAYMKYSEQVDSVIAVSTLSDGDAVVAAGGYVVQLLPEARRESLVHMTDHLDALPSLSQLLREAPAPHALVEKLLVDMPFTKLDERPVVFKCRCSDERVLASLATLPRHELEDMRAEAKVFEISCDFCGKTYNVGPAELTSLLDVN